MKELQRALLKYKAGLAGVALYSSVMNVLMMTGPLFMLQVYDRVLASRSPATLAVLFLIAMYCYVVSGLLDHFRGRLLNRIGAAFQSDMDGRAMQIFLRQAELSQQCERNASALRDLATIRAMLSSPGMGALFDLPWVLFYIGVMFLFHPLLGWFSLASGLVVLLVALLNQRLTRRPQAEAASLAAQAETHAEIMRREIQTIRGLGMVANMTASWHRKRDASLRSAVAASDAGVSFSAATKALRFLIQSAVLGLGAWLVLLGEMTAGAMIAGSILLGRALAPVEQVVGHWSQLQNAKASWNNLNELLKAVPPERKKTKLPKPRSRLEVRDLAVVPPGGSVKALQGVTFSAEPGDVIGVIGPSASGKSTLAQALAGLWLPSEGEIRLDGADLQQYDDDQLGSYLGFLPQDVVLFSGTVAQNIARLDFVPDSEAVIEAARQAEADEMIRILPKGYDTWITEGGGQLSGGQRQRIALARANFGDPVALILDEPNSNLDIPGANALNRAIDNARATGKIVLVMSHLPSVLEKCNKALILENGHMRVFDPSGEILKRIDQLAWNNVSENHEKSDLHISKSPITLTNFSIGDFGENE